MLLLAILIMWLLIISNHMITKDTEEALKAFNFNHKEVVNH